jgi:catechol 2,3-dioxygenase
MKRIQNINNAEYSIHDDTKIGSIVLKVSNMDRQVRFYRQLLGFQILKQETGQAVLGSGANELLQLVEQPDYKQYRRVTGLYHFAVLLPSRGDLARVVKRLHESGYPNYPTDHILTKTTYLEDSEGNGIELYCESPEDGTWIMDQDSFYAHRADGSVSSGREPLNVEALFKHLEADARLDLPVPEGTRIGHVHLHVHNLDAALDFYHGQLGFNIMGRTDAARMAFVSAGGYHHHIGLNTWQGEGAPAPPPDSLGLSYYSIELPDDTSLEEITWRIEQAGISTEKTGGGIYLQDPSRNGVMLTVKNNRPVLDP